MNIEINDLEKQKYALKKQSYQLLEIQMNKSEKLKIEWKNQV